MTSAGPHADAAPGSPLLGLARAGLCGDAAPEAMLWDDLDLDDADDRRFGDYELLERIGRGGMGVVFRAHQISLDREVAVKFIVGSLAADAQAVARFLAEARAAARLNHPHIVPVFEVGSVEGMHFFSMPLLRGQTLAQRIETRKMPHADSVRLLLDLGAAVDYAHGFGLLHLDLKPANVLFDVRAQPLIGDFGLARHMDGAGGVDAHEVCGTPAYMAPEQVAAGTHRLDQRTDVHALGAILYELLTGIAPHAAGDPKARRPATADLVPPRARDASIAPDLEAICLKCLQPDPDRRYARVADFTADLVRYRDGNDVSARRPRWHERVARSLRRHPEVTLATAAGLAALVIGLVATSWQWQRAERERAEAARQQALAIAQAARLHQLAGLLAATFPTGESTRAQRIGSARAAVAWLKHNASDPSAQRAVLTSFREALSAAGKADAVSALLSEIVDQLGVDYRERQVARLARAGDRDSLIAAALIGIPRGDDTASSATHEAVVQRLAAEYPDDQLALYVAALACHVQPQPCAHPEYAARLTAQFPDNAVHWVLAPRGAGLDDAGIAANVLHAARARLRRPPAGGDRDSAQRAARPAGARFDTRADAGRGRAIRSGAVAAAQCRRQRRAAELCRRHARVQAGQRRRTADRRPARCLRHVRPQRHALAAGLDHGGHGHRRNRPAPVQGHAAGSRGEGIPPPVHLAQPLRLARRIHPPGSQFRQPAAGPGPLRRVGGLAAPGRARRRIAHTAGGLAAGRSAPDAAVGRTRTGAGAIGLEAVSAAVSAAHGQRHAGSEYAWAPRFLRKPGRRGLQQAGTVPASAALRPSCVARPPRTRPRGRAIPAFAPHRHRRPRVAALGDRAKRLKRRIKMIR